MLWSSKTGAAKALEHATPSLVRGDRTQYPQLTSISEYLDHAVDGSIGLQSALLARRCHFAAFYLDHLRGNPHCRAAIGQIIGDHGVGPNDHIVADPNRPGDLRSCSPLSPITVTPGSKPAATEAPWKMVKLRPMTAKGWMPVLPEWGIHRPGPMTASTDSRTPESVSLNLLRA